jgi:hypothetical protein
VAQVSGPDADIEYDGADGVAARPEPRRIMTIIDTAAQVRAAVANAGATISAQRAQDIAFSLYDLSTGDTRVALETLLTLSLTRVWFETGEIESVLGDIEAQNLLVSEV